jgi:hypothetical protein
MSTIKTLLTAYFDHLHEIHASGRATDERSYYPALAELFNGLRRCECLLPGEGLYLDSP